MDNGTLIVCCLPIAIIVGGFAIWFLGYALRRRKLEEAKKGYQDSLAALKKAPTDTELRQLALGWGREYARRLRSQGRETIFDEVALMNDLNAVTGGRVESVERTTKVSIRARLHQLKELRQEGLISDEEYRKRRDEILRET